jgi:hypothetical protein
MPKIMPVFAFLRKSYKNVAAYMIQASEVIVDYGRGFLITAGIFCRHSPEGARGSQGF